MRTLLINKELPMSTWTIDHAHTEIGFSVRHLMISNVRGHFKSFEGTVVANDDTFKDAKISLTIDPASISTNNDMRDGHLKSADFFEVEKFPTLTFESTSFVATGDRQYEIKGNMTMHGVTKEISFVATLEGFGKNMQGARVASFDLTGSIIRSDFGLTWNAAIETGGVTVSDEVKFNFTTELVEQA